MKNPCEHEIGPWPAGQQWPRCLKCEIERLQALVDRMLWSMQKKAEMDLLPRAADEPRRMTRVEVDAAHTAMERAFWRSVEIIDNGIDATGDGGADEPKQVLG